MKITINGVEIEVDDNCEVSVDGTKITVKARQQAVEHHYHHHYHSAPPLQQWWTQPTPWLPNWPTITITSPPNSLPTVTCGDTSVASSIVQVDSITAFGGQSTPTGFASVQ